MLHNQSAAVAKQLKRIEGALVARGADPKLVSAIAGDRRLPVHEKMMLFHDIYNKIATASVR